MKTQVLKFVLMLAWIAMTNTAAASSSPANETMKCDTGPASKNFGNTEWLVYSCADAKLIVLVSAPSNPALPFYFFLSFKDGKYHVTGEGLGNKDASKAAFEELSLLTNSEIASLISQTQSKKQAPTPAQ